MAKKVYKKAEDKADCVDDLIDLAEEVYEYLDEKDLTKKIYLKADKACASENYYCYINLANSLIEKLDDRKWAKERGSYANTTNYTNGVFCFHSVHANRRGSGYGRGKQNKVDP